jgi:Amt family ammonium transporter
LRGLYWEWYPLDQSVDVAVARLWGVIALRGWALSGEANTPTALSLFAVHLSLLGAATIIPVSVLLRQAKAGLAMLTGLVMGGLIYPLGGNWLWGGGWLFNLGANLGLGHGFVDFGGSSVIFLAGSVVAGLALLVFKPESTESPRKLPEVSLPLTDNSLTVYKDPAPVFVGEETADSLPSTPMPSAYLPILGLLGAGLALVGWFGLITGLHTPTAVDFMPARAGVNALLSALGAAVTAAGYSWFTTRALNPLMTARGLCGGLIVAMAGGPFLPPWLFLCAGLVLGLLLPSLIYLFEQGFSLGDQGGGLATYGVSALSGLLLVGLLADGQAGQGWNGLDGPGVTGLLLAAERSGQFQAQVVGSVAIIILALAGGLLLFQTTKVVVRSWASTGLELADPALISKAASKSRASTTESTTQNSKSQHG